MKRLHVHVAVEDLAQSTQFYSTLFASEPTVVKDDYVKWMLDDPRVNFAISTRPGRAAGVSHLGIQAEDEAELAEVYDRLARAERPTIEAKATTCCYAKSDKQWIADPQGVPWETFFTYGESTVYGEGSLARLKEIREAEAMPQAAPDPAGASAYCAPAGVTAAMDDAQIKEIVRARYGGIAEAAGADSCCAPASSCCGDTAAGTPADKSRQMGYSDAELAAVPDGANLGLGCGNPQGIAGLKPGEVVIDLGSGAGFDCFLAARQVGAGGRVIGVDMTHEMLKKARENAAKISAANVEFRLGELEHLPVADSTADAILSNCVINLVPDKAQVYREDAARLVVYWLDLPAAAAGGADRQLHRRPDHPRRRAVHGDGIRVVQPDRWRAEFHADAGGAQRHHHGVRVCADRCTAAWAVLDHGAVDDAVSFRRALHRRAGDRRPALAALAAGARWGACAGADPTDPAADLADRAAGDFGAVVRIPGRTDCPAAAHHRAVGGADHHSGLSERRHCLRDQPRAWCPAQCRVPVGPDRRLQFLRARGRRSHCAVRFSIRRRARDRRRRSGRSAGHALRCVDRVADPGVV